MTRTDQYYEQAPLVVKEALEWIGTPYMPNARVKGKDGGVDCLTFIAGAYENAGVVPYIDIPPYSPQWHLHQEEERYLDGVMEYCVEIEGPPMPGDMVFWKFGKCYSHSAIVIKWPVIIHAWLNRAVGRDDADRRTILKTVHEIIALRNTPRPRKFLTFKHWVA